MVCVRIETIILRITSTCYNFCIVLFVNFLILKLPIDILRQIRPLLKCLHSGYVLNVQNRNPKCKLIRQSIKELLPETPLCPALHNLLCHIGQWHLVDPTTPIGFFLEKPLETFIKFIKFDNFIKWQTEYGESCF